MTGSGPLRVFLKLQPNNCSLSEAVTGEKPLLFTAVKAFSGRCELGTLLGMATETHTEKKKQTELNSSLVRQHHLLSAKSHR